MQLHFENQRSPLAFSLSHVLLKLFRRPPKLIPQFRRVREVLECTFGTDTFALILLGRLDLSSSKAQVTSQEEMIRFIAEKLTQEVAMGVYVPAVLDPYFLQFPF